MATKPERRSAIAGFVLSLVADLAVFAGAAAIGRGLWTIYEPATWIFGGACLAALGILIGRRVS